MLSYLKEEFLIDFTGYEMPDGKFILKELCITTVDSEDFDDEGNFICKYIMYKPPHEYHQEVFIKQSKDEWKNGHGISWDVGDREYSKLENEIKNLMRQGQYIFIQDAEKKKKFENIIDSFSLTLSIPIILLENMRFYDHLRIYYPYSDCPLRKCHLRRCNYDCAFENAQRMKTWFTRKWDTDSSYSRSVQIYYQLQDLSKMSTSDINCLDEPFILLFAKREIDSVWDKLPLKFQSNQKFIDYQRCRDHECIFGDFYPFKKDCYKCNETI